MLVSIKNKSLDLWQWFYNVRGTYPPEYVPANVSRMKQGSIFRRVHKIVKSDY